MSLEASRTSRNYSDQHRNGDRKLSTEKESIDRDLNDDQKKRFKLKCSHRHVTDKKVIVMEVLKHAIVADKRNSRG